MENLLVTLGHNSSCILVRNDEVVCGYEEERLSLIKSDSRFPQLSILKCLEYSEENVDGIYVSHWFPFGELPKNPNKYWNPFWIHNYVPGNPTVYSVSADFTHHDSHAHSAIAFCRNEFPTENAGIIVADGFGNFGECLSIYDITSDKRLQIRHRSFGYSDSLGLMYQYTTAFLGMKENQDEYKLLGYEPRAWSMFPTLYDVITERAIKDGVNQASRLLGSHKIGNKYDPMYAVDALPAIRLKYGLFLNDLLNDISSVEKLDEYEKKVIISYYAQRRLEAAIGAIVKESGYKKLILVGGVFMNVKLNLFLTDMVEKISIMPLAGDQGAAIGLFSAMNAFKWPDHLFWGIRSLKKPNSKPRNFYHFHSEPVAKHYIIDLLQKNYVVNVVRGAMEFGARSLCHTSTLALPTQENVDYINSCNGRDTIMPMAPVILPEALDTLFDDHNKVIKSLDYMITALRYRDGSNYTGASNYYPINNVFTGRPQIAREQFIQSILKEVRDGILINTSMNEHGMPICYGINDVIRCHVSQLNQDINNRINTVVIDNE